MDRDRDEAIRVGTEGESVTRHLEEKCKARDGWKGRAKGGKAEKNVGGGEEWLCGGSQEEEGGVSAEDGGSLLTQRGRRKPEAHRESVTQDT